MLCTENSLSARTQQCKPGSLAVFHTATVTGSQSTWVIYSLLATQTQAWCFPNNMKTQISPHRTRYKIGKIFLEHWWRTPDTSKGLKAISSDHPLKILLLLLAWHSNFPFSHCFHITLPFSSAIPPFHLLEIPTTVFQTALTMFLFLIRLNTNSFSNNASFPGKLM